MSVAAVVAGTALIRSQLSQRKKSANPAAQHLIAAGMVRTAGAQKFKYRPFNYRN
jgi:hypothetical protein